jgi:hypothetical protein
VSLHAGSTGFFEILSVTHSIIVSPITFGKWHDAIGKSISYLLSNIKLIRGEIHAYQCYGN